MRSKDLQSHKILGYTSIGYELITDSGSVARLAYIPYSRKYVKLVEIEDGKMRHSLVLTAKALSSLSQRLESARSSKKSRRKLP
ncbi:hypothetical protein [Paenibacillus graminis]|uniref:hypothetical protein n=1 Tax=Paenibacillus graminis TaxID=189425 RepID=UPI002DBAA993|nr:hypothetical protein [Paenibacillus graminis]MEC0167405.1 hypothetical protein [Paenibacillus graminis]